MDLTHNFYEILYRIRDDHTKERVGYVVCHSTTNTISIETKAVVIAIAKNGKLPGFKCENRNNEEVIVVDESVNHIKMSDIPEISISDAISKVTNKRNTNYIIAYLICNFTGENIGYILYNTYANTLEPVNKDTANALARTRRIHGFGVIIFPNDNNKTFIAPSPSSNIELKDIPKVVDTKVKDVINQGIPYERLMHQVNNINNAVEADFFSKQPASRKLDATRIPNDGNIPYAKNDSEDPFKQVLSEKESDKKSSETEVNQKVKRSKGIFDIFKAFNKR